jgi:hypothetical protein
MWANVFAPRLTYLDGFSFRASLLKYIANTQIICDEFIFLEIGQYILGYSNIARPQIKKKIKLIIFIITPFFGVLPKINSYNKNNIKP